MSLFYDSRTGLSHTSGICTIQMPDEFVVCFTLNRQSILGAASAATSADIQRRRSDSTPLGGERKTSLIAKWAAELAARDRPGCNAVFAWSFYSQCQIPN